MKTWTIETPWAQRSLASVQMRVYVSYYSLSTKTRETKEFRFIFEITALKWVVRAIREINNPLVKSLFSKNWTASRKRYGRMKKGGMFKISSDWKRSGSLCSQSEILSNLQGLTDDDSSTQALHLKTWQTPIPDFRRDPSFAVEEKKNSGPDIDIHTISSCHSTTMQDTLTLCFFFLRSWQSMESSPRMMRM